MNYKKLHNYDTFTAGSSQTGNIQQSSIETGENLEIPLINESHSVLPLSRPITISWKNLVVSSRPPKNIFRKVIMQPKQILQNVSGVVKPGQLIAIMGLSGSGKTTLLTVLTGRYLKGMDVRGGVFLNGNPADGNTIVNESGYVQQNDLFEPVLTVREHLIFHSLLRMDQGLTKVERERRVDSIIEKFSLTDCKNIKIGSDSTDKGISGGQAKRLSFASEYLKNPAIMFCDEPTSGLDSFMAKGMIEKLKSMASEGRTVICTIHQPSSQVFALFEHLLLLVKGRVAFMGETEKAKELFGNVGYTCQPNYNPADFYIDQLEISEMETESSARINKICNAYDSYVLTKHESIPDTTGAESIFPAPKYLAGVRRQMCALLWRLIFIVFRGKSLLYVTIGLSIAPLLGIVFYQEKVNQKTIRNINSSLFILLMNMTIINLMSVINTFCGARPLFLREHHNRMYRVVVYFIAQNIVDLPIYLLQTILFVFIYYFMVGLNADFTRFLTAMAIVILISQCAISYSYFMSCVTTSADTALKLGSLLLTPIIIFGGYLLDKDTTSAWVKYFYNLSWFYYGFEALVINQWNGIKFDDCPNKCNSASDCISTGQEVIEKVFDFREDHLGRNIRVLATFVIGFRLLAFLVLYCRSQRQPLRWSPARCCCRR